MTIGGENGLDDEKTFCWHNDYIAAAATARMLMDYDV